MATCLSLSFPILLLNKANVSPQMAAYMHTRALCFLGWISSTNYVIQREMTLMEKVILVSAVSSGEIEYLPRAYG